MKDCYFPQVSPGTHSGAVLLQSNMILFQSSPVVMANRSKKASKKLLKFLRSSITSPDLMFPNMNTPRIENMKKISIRSMNTLNSTGIENMIVWIIAYRPSAFPARRRTLVTLRTLITLASWGPTFSSWIVSASNIPRIMSKIELITTKKSNLFQEFLR